jgi:WD40 repeat protein/tRNA A-37 threonylcarbamoyl transferase component Bud32
MKPERWEQIERLYFAARERAPGLHAAFLDQACAGDESLRQEVESLLASDEQAGDFLNTPALKIAMDEIADEQARSLVGRQLGHYRLLSQLGAGGMGEVYLAERADDQYRKQVAIKLVKRGMDTDNILRRFRHERQILAALDHPNIARLLDGGVSEDGLPYFVMEFIAGRPITEYCDSHQLSTEARLKLFRQVCDAVHYAHQNLVVHRDLKPGNILVTEEGAPRLLDFGIAKVFNPELASPTLDLTAPEIRLMTPEYASPEQVRGEPITTASDIYSLGVVLYELLTGHHPYRTRNVRLSEIIRIVCEKEPEKPSAIIGRVEEIPGADGPRPITPESVGQTREGQSEKLRRRLAGDVDNIVLMALCKEPQRRYGSVMQFSEDVRRHLEGLPVIARKDTLGYRSAKFLQRHKAGVAATALFLTLVIGFIVSLAVKSAQVTSERDNNRRLLYVAQMNLAGDAWETNNITRMEELLNSQLPEAGREDLRGFEWYLLWRLGHSHLLTFQHKSPVTFVTFSPDGKKLATGSDEHTVKLWDAATGHEIVTLKGHGGWVLSAAFSPDGQRLATGSTDNTAALWDVATGKELCALKGHRDEVVSVAFSADGKRLATGGGDHTAKLWDVATGHEIFTFKGHGSKVWSTAISPDGKKLVTGSEDRTEKLWDAATGQEIVTLKGRGAEVLPVAFSPDGRKLALGSQDRTVKLWDVATGHELVSFKGHRDVVESVAFSPDGKRLATGSADHTAKLWDVATGQEIVTLKGHGDVVESLAFSADGRRLATGSRDNTAKLWDVATGQEIVTLKGHGAEVASVAFSPDGRRLATGSRDNTAKLWDAATGHELVTLKGHEAGVASVAFSPDGRRLATASYDHTAKLWGAATGQEIVTLKGHGAEVPSVAFSPDGKRLATGSYDQTAKLWDVATGQELLTFKGHTGNVNTVAFSPDGKKLAVGSFDRTVTLSDVATGKELATLRGHAGYIIRVAFSPDGKRLATGCRDRTAKLWDLVTGQELVTLRGHSGQVLTVAFSPDGRALATGSYDGLVKLWRTATEQETPGHGKQ